MVTPQTGIQTGVPRHSTGLWYAELTPDSVAARTRSHGLQGRRLSRPGGVRSPARPCAGVRSPARPSAGVRSPARPSAGVRSPARPSGGLI